MEKMVGREYDEMIAVRRGSGASMKRNREGKRSLTGQNGRGRRHKIKLRNWLLFPMLADWQVVVAATVSVISLYVNCQPKLDSSLLQILVLRLKHGLQCWVFIVRP